MTLSRNKNAFRPYCRRLVNQLFWSLLDRIIINRINSSPLIHLLTHRMYHWKVINLNKSHADWFATASALRLDGVLFCFLRIAEFYIGDPPTLNLEIMPNMASTTWHASADMTMAMISIVNTYLLSILSIIYLSIVSGHMQQILWFAFRQAFVRDPHGMAGGRVADVHVRPTAKAAHGDLKNAILWRT